MRCQTCDGPIKPEITFFGEQLKNNFKEVQEVIGESSIRNLREALSKITANMRKEVEKMQAEIRGIEATGKVPDIPEEEEEESMEGCDLLIIIGPSINHHPICQTANMTTKGCPQVLINNDNQPFNYMYNF